MKRVLNALLLAAASPLTTAGVINFDDLNLENLDPISATYADHGAGGQGDARVGVQYSGSGGADNHLLFWNDLFGPLLKVALTPTDGTMAQITLTADPGWLIQSIGFDLAAWPMIELEFWPAVDIMADVFYALDDVSVDAPGTLVLGKSAPHFNHFALSHPNGAAVATMRWGTDWDVGIDNIHFTVVRDNRVPLPSTLALASLALLLVLGWRKRDDQGGLVALRN
jgi:hypothetical protein